MTESNLRHLPATPFCDRVAERLLVALLLFMPLAFGAVEAWSEFVVWAGCTGLCVCLGIRALNKRTTGGLIWTPAYIPLALFVLLGLFQAIPVPFSVIELLSPHAAGLYQSLREDVLGSFSISLYPRATWHDLCLVAAASIIFMTVVNVIRHTAQIKRMLLAIGLIGAALVVLAILQNLFGNKQIYWIGPNEVQPYSGTFICHNHFSQHINLSIMAMLAYAMVSIRQTLGGQWLKRESIGEWITHPDLRLSRWLIVFAISGLIAVAMSLSRMGIVSAAAAVVALMLMLTVGKGQHRSAVPLLVGILALSAVILIGFEMVFERMETLTSFDSYEKRWQVITDMVPAFAHFPIIGSGLGTFSAVYPMYDTGTRTLFASHAENEYAQLLLEMGVVGAAMGVWFLGYIVASTALVVKRMDQPLFLASPALAAGLIAVGIHSWSDFGQHLPAIAALSAVFCGLLVVLGQRTAAESGLSRYAHAELPHEPQPGTLPAATSAWITRPQVVVGLTGLLGMILALNLPASYMRIFAEESDAAARETSATFEKARWRISPEEYARLIALGERSVKLDPGNVLYRYQLGVYRWRAAVRGRAKAELGAATPPELQQAAERIVNEMILASAKCPTMGAVHCWRGQMEWWVLGLAEGRDRVENGIRTAGNDPIAWGAAGQLAAVEGHPDLALQRFRRAVQLRRSTLQMAVESLLQDCRRPDLVLAIAGDDPLLLYDSSRMLLDRGFAQEGQEARSKSIRVFRSRVNDSATPTWVLAMLAEASSQEGRHEEAIGLYQRALGKQYTQLSWRLACIQELLTTGRVDDAHREVQVCQRLAPDSSDVAALEAKIAASQRRGGTTRASKGKVLF